VTIVAAIQRLHMSLMDVAQNKFYPNPEGDDALSGGITLMKVGALPKKEDPLYSYADLEVVILFINLN